MQQDLIGSAAIKDSTFVHFFKERNTLVKYFKKILTMEMKSGLSTINLEYYIYYGPVKESPGRNDHF